MTETPDPFANPQAPDGASAPPPPYVAPGNVVPPPTPGSAPVLGPPPGMPQYGAPQYATPQYGAPGQQASGEKNILGILALVAPFVAFSAVGIVLGHLALRAVKQGKANNKGIAMAGTIVSWVFTAFSIVGILTAIAIPIYLTQQEKADEAAVKADLSNLQFAVVAAYAETGAMPDVTLDGGIATVGDRTVPISTDVTSFDYVLLDGESFCIGIEYAGFKSYSIQETGTAQWGSCPAAGVEPIDDATGDDGTDADPVEGTMVGALGVGDCFLDPVSGGDAGADGPTEVNGYEVVPCDTPHYGETYAVVATTATEFDVDAISAEADAVCIAEFETFVGLPYDDSSLYADVYYPTQESWDLGDREIVCAISVVTGDAVGTFAGSGL